LVVPEREWKEIILDARELGMKHKGRNHLALEGKRCFQFTMMVFCLLYEENNQYLTYLKILGRLQDTSKETKARQDKHGQHKLGQGGYGILKAWVVSA
jgi:hypothetical protein